MNYTSLIIGWILGILGTVLGKLLIDSIKQLQKKEEIKKGLFTEFKGVRLRLAITTYQVCSILGTLNRDLLTWCFDILSEAEDTEATSEILPAMKELMKLDDEKIQAIISNQGKAALSLKKFFLPFLDSNINNLSLFDVKFQNFVLEIRAKLNLLNEEIDLSRFFYEKTFDSSLSPKNHQIINKNLDQLYQNVANIARLTADKITNLIQNFGDQRK